MIIGIIIYLVLIKNNVIEGFSDSVQLDSVALESVASVYNNKNLTIDNLKVTGNIEVDGYTKSKAFALTGHEYSDAEAKAIQGDGIFYRTAGQATIGTDDHLYIRNNNNGNTVDINNGTINAPGSIRGSVLFGKRGIENDRKDHNPSDYRKKGMGMYDEFKNIIGGWSIIRTIVPWHDTTGGNITQFAFNTGGNLYTRTANEKANKWNGWTRMIKANDKGTFRNIYTGKRLNKNGSFHNSNRGSHEVGTYEVCDIAANDGKTC